MRLPSTAHTVVSVSHVLLITHILDPEPFSNSCLSQHYYGTFGEHRVYIPTFSCLEKNIVAVNSSYIFDLPSTVGDLVWIQRADKSRLQNNGDNELEEILEHVKNVDALSLQSAVSDSGSGQKILAPNAPIIDVLYRTPASLFISISHPYSKLLDLILPEFYTSIMLPDEPYSQTPVPEESIVRLQELLMTQRYEKQIDLIVNNITIRQMEKDITSLTGESRDSPIKSRHSLSKDALVAANWLQKELESTGAECRQEIYLVDFSPNIICEYGATTNTTGTVMLTAHYDSTSRRIDGINNAPGANDDGSGTLAILSIARAIGRQNIKFRNNVQLVLFSGEEQGLIGSMYYAQTLRREEKNLTLAIQADMIGYHAPGEAPQLAVPTYKYISTEEVSDLIRNASALYSPELEVVTIGICCSDHQNFHERGFPATIVSEHKTDIVDPWYHSAKDVSDRRGYDLEQIKSIAKVEFAVLLHAAGFYTQD